MAADIGRNFKLEMGTGTSGTALVAAMRTTSFTVNGETVDITNKDSGGFRELLGTAGVSSVSVSAEGVLTGSTTSNGFYGRARAKSIDAYTLKFDAGTITGLFQTVSFGGAGAHNGEQTYSLTLESSGTFSAFA
jgi:TP901-1 family phage major tail protein